MKVTLSEILIAASVVAVGLVIVSFVVTVGGMDGGNANNIAAAGGSKSFSDAVKGLARTDFSDLHGKHQDEATKVIKASNPNLYVQIVKPGQALTRDLVSNRVRLHVNEQGIVQNNPYVG